MTTEQLQNAIHAVPFCPFVLRLANGEEVRVPHPDFIAHRPAGRTAAVEMPNDTTKIIDLLLVVALDVEHPGDLASIPDVGE